MAVTLKCQGIKPDGTPCKAKPHRVDPTTGYCIAHGPGASERMAELGRRGAKATAKRFGGSGIASEDLPPLKSHQEAAQWLETIARAVVVGRLSNRDAVAAARCIEIWMDARSGSIREEDLAELREQIRQLKAPRSEGKVVSMR